MCNVKNQISKQFRTHRDPGIAWFLKKNLLQIKKGWLSKLTSFLKSFQAEAVMKEWGKYYKLSSTNSIFCLDFINEKSRPCNFLFSSIRLFVLTMTVFINMFTVSLILLTLDRHCTFEKTLFFLVKYSEKK